VGLYLSPGKDARLHITRSWQMGKPFKFAAAWGIDPLFMVVGSQTFPRTSQSMNSWAGLKVSPIPVIKGKTTDLLLPANAEFVIEGIIKPNSVRSEGPFVNSLATTEDQSRLSARRSHCRPLPKQSNIDECVNGRLPKQ